jgi:hypothetical protein
MKRLKPCLFEDLRGCVLAMVPCLKFISGHTVSERNWRRIDLNTVNFGSQANALVFFCCMTVLKFLGPESIVRSDQATPSLFSGIFFRQTDGTSVVNSSVLSNRLWGMIHQTHWIHSSQSISGITSVHWAPVYTVTRMEIVSGTFWSPDGPP